MYLDNLFFLKDLSQILDHFLFFLKDLSHCYVCIPLVDSAAILSHPLLGFP